MAFYFNTYTEGGQALDMRAVLSQIVRGAAADGRGPTVDDGQVLAAAEQLKAVEARLYEASAKPLKSELVIPRKFNAGQWAISTAYRTLTGSAKMVPTSGLGDGLPEAAAGIEEYSEPVHEFGNGYGYSNREMWQAAHMGIPLDDTKARLCMRAYEELVDLMAALGYADLKIHGLLNSPALDNGTRRQMSDITISPNTSNSQIVSFLHAIMGLIEDRTNEAEKPDCLVMPTKCRRYLASQPYSDQDTRSILEVLVANSDFLRSTDDVISWNRFKSAGRQKAGTARHIIGAWRRDELVLRQQIPLAFTPEEPITKGRRVITNCVALIGGVEVIQPDAIQLMEIPDDDTAIDAVLTV